MSTASTGYTERPQYAEGAAYLQHFRVSDIFKELTTALILNKPTSPYRYLAEAFSEIDRQATMGRVFEASMLKTWMESRAPTPARPSSAAPWVRPTSSLSSTRTQRAAMILAAQNTNSPLRRPGSAGASAAYHSTRPSSAPLYRENRDVPRPNLGTPNQREFLPDSTPTAQRIRQDVTGPPSATSTPARAERLMSKREMDRLERGTTDHDDSLSESLNADITDADLRKGDSHNWPSDDDSDDPDQQLAAQTSALSSSVLARANASRSRTHTSIAPNTSLGSPIRASPGRSVRASPGARRVAFNAHPAIHSISRPPEWSDSDSSDGGTIE